MSESITLPTNIEWGQNQQTIDFITSQVNEVEKLYKSMIERVATIGKVFVIVQQNSKDKTFLTWIESSANTTTLKKSAVYLYMKIYRNYELVKDTNNFKEALELIGKKLEDDDTSKKSTAPETNEPEAIKSFRNTVGKLKVDEKYALLGQMSTVCEDLLSDTMLNYEIYKDVEDSKDGLKGLKELKNSILLEMKKDENKDKKNEFEKVKKTVNDYILEQTKEVDNALKRLKRLAEK